MHLSAQLSVYPLRQEQLSPVIRDLHEALAAAGLDVTPGPMSTLVAGDGAILFDALKAAFLDAAGRGPLVLTATISNACPV